MKAVMLRSRTRNRNEIVNKHSKDAYKTVKPLSFPPRTFTKANLNELFSELISENSLSEKNEVDVPTDEPGSKSILLVSSSSVNAINPGNIRKLMSIPGKIKSIPNKKQTDFSNDITINGKTYRECIQHATCYITKSIRSSMY